MRAFVAIDVPPAVLDSLARFQSELGAAGADLKLVEKENLHFTVKFLGEITEAQAEETGRRLASLSLKKGTIEMKGTGAFPSTARPRVVWAGVASEQEEFVVKIAGAVASSLNGIGERDDRPFRAHLTLGRVRSLSNVKALAELLERNSGRTFGKAELSELKLKSSRLTSSGPIYSDIGAYPLN